MERDSDTLNFYFLFIYDIYEYLSLYEVYIYHIHEAYECGCPKDNSVTSGKLHWDPEHTHILPDME